MYKGVTLNGKISVQPHTTLCIQFLNRENNDKNNAFPLGKQICFAIVWGYTETLPFKFFGYFALFILVKSAVDLNPWRRCDKGLSELRFPDRWKSLIKAP